MSGDLAERTFDVAVYVGKPLDVVALKSQSLQDILDYAAFLQETARKLYAGEGRRIEHCPCCATATSSAEPVLSIFEVTYVRCASCGHVFVALQPTEEALSEQFATSEKHSETYVDVAGLEKRMDQVARPKARWVVDVFEDIAGRRPENAIDVGAGGGHFVAAMKELGVGCTGYELSEPSRRFAREALSIDLVAKSFFDDSDPADIITMWGLLEYVPEPGRFVAAARERLNPGGVLVVEVPRFASISTAVQTVFPDRVARHLDPTTHVNCFSDGSLATLVLRAGLRPRAAWYFGMDVYETLVQTAIERREETLPADLLPLIPALQDYLDEARCCDDIVLAVTVDDSG